MGREGGRGGGREGRKEEMCVVSFVSWKLRGGQGCLVEGG
jgi:hypothetical protein